MAEIIDEMCVCVCARCVCMLHAHIHTTYTCIHTGTHSGIKKAYSLNIY